MAEGGLAAAGAPAADAMIQGPSRRGEDSQARCYRCAGVIPGVWVIVVSVVQPGYPESTGLNSAAHSDWARGRTQWPRDCHVITTCDISHRRLQHPLHRSISIQTRLLPTRCAYSALAYLSSDSRRQILLGPLLGRLNMDPSHENNQKDYSFARVCDLKVPVEVKMWV